MTQLFRKVRKDMAGKNKFTVYLAYAIGEIALVVIGILLALQINNANEAQKNELIIKHALKQIHDDLRTSILEADEKILYYMERDSMVHSIMTDQLTVDDYKSPRGLQLITLTISFDLPNIQTEGFNTLINLSDKLTSQYDSIVMDLKDLYINKKANVDLSGRYIDELTSENIDWLKHNTDWFSTLYFLNNNFYNELSNDQIDFYLNEPYYKNIVTEYSFLGPRNHYSSIRNFRSKAIEIYQHLSEKLHLEDQKLYDLQDYKDYIGKFVNDRDTLEILIEEERLMSYYRSEGEEQIDPIVPLTDSKFSFESAGFGYLKHDTLKQVSGLRMRYSTSSYEFDKIEE
ncbi:MAG: DUF6090 family protein [Bacteroidota bacterium]